MDVLWSVGVLVGDQRATEAVVGLAYRREKHTDSAHGIEHLGTMEMVS